MATSRAPDRVWFHAAIHSACFRLSDDVAVSSLTAHASPAQRRGDSRQRRFILRQPTRETHSACFGLSDARQNRIPRHLVGQISPQYYVELLQCGARFLSALPTSCKRPVCFPLSLVLLSTAATSFHVASQISAKSDMLVVRLVPIVGPAKATAFLFLSVIRWSWIAGRFLVLLFHMEDCLNSLDSNLGGCGVSASAYCISLELLVSHLAVATDTKRADAQFLAWDYLRLRIASFTTKSPSAGLDDHPDALRVRHPAWKTASALPTLISAAAESRPRRIVLHSSFCSTNSDLGRCRLSASAFSTPLWASAWDYLRLEIPSLTARHLRRGTRTPSASDFPRQNCFSSTNSDLGRYRLSPSAFCTPPDLLVTLDTLAWDDLPLDIASLFARHRRGGSATTNIPPVSVPPGFELPRVPARSIPAAAESRPRARIVSHLSLWGNGRTNVQDMVAFFAAHAGRIFHPPSPNHDAFAFEDSPERNFSEWRGHNGIEGGVPVFKEGQDNDVFSSFPESVAKCRSRHSLPEAWKVWLQEPFQQGETDSWCLSSFTLL
ncbi:hypothetical protein DFH06DRAFT_1149742 [Mycena polygramma]|nr:hypothetical protein DFH06DRAFT_1149742 [Mycena polygramma]